MGETIEPIALPQVKAARAVGATTAQNEVNRFGLPVLSAGFRTFPLNEEAVKRNPRFSDCRERVSLASRDMGSTVGFSRTMKILGVSRKELFALERSGQLMSCRASRGEREYVFADVFRLARKGMPDCPVPPMCRSTLPLHRGVPVFTYFVQAVTGGLVKIGITNNVQKRLIGLQNSCPIPLRYLAVINGDKEEHLHVRFAHLRRHGEWFEPATELMAYIAECAERVSV